MAEKTSKMLLDMWRAAFLDGVRSNDPDLTMRQMSILLSVYMTDPPHTVRGLAAELHVAKPVITRALDSMGHMGLLKRKRDDTDRRNVLIQRTVKGAVFLSELSDRIVRAEHEAAAAEATAIADTGSGAGKGPSNSNGTGGGADLQVTGHMAESDAGGAVAHSR